MKKLMSLMIAGAVLAVAGSASAGEFRLFRVAGPRVHDPSQAPPSAVPPAPISEGAVFSHSHATVVEAMPIQLFNCVRYVDCREMHPCAVKKIVLVKDPCPSKCCNPCNCCAPKCVAIEICVPPCGCERVKCRRNGTRITYDYGKYSVDIRVKKGYIVVDYQD